MGPAVGSIGSVVITSSTTGQATVFPVSPASLGIGTFASTITVRACLNDQTCATGQLSGSPQTITVSYTVSGLSASSSTVNLSALETLGSAAAPIDLSNAAGSASWTSSIAYTGVGPSGWLTLTPPSAPSLPATINFSGGPLAPGTYTATATLSAGTDSLPVGVTYIVIKALTPAPASLSYTIGDAPVPGDLTRDVTFAATTPAVNWSAAANVPWLSVTASGNTGASNHLTAGLVPAQVDALSNGDYLGLITVTPSTGTVTTIPVTLTVARTQVNAVAPYIAIAGVAGNVIVRGENLLQSSDVLFDAQGAAGQISVVSSTEIRAAYPALAAGTYAVKAVKNGANSRSLANLVVVSAPTYISRTLDYPDVGSKNLQVLFYDAERTALVVGDPTKLIRYAFTTDWQAPTSIAISSLRGAALSVDGKKLLAIVDTAVKEVDPASLAVGATTTGSGLGFEFLKDIVVPNDGKALITTGVNGSGFSDFYFYSTLGPTLTHGSGPYFGVPGISGDGSLTVIVQGGLSPPAPVLKYLASTDTFAAAGIDLAGVTPPALDRTGTRIVLERTRVVDGTFAALGALPATTLAAVLKADGSRAYTFDSSGSLRTFDLSGAAPGTGVVYPEVLPATTLAGSPGTTGVKMVISPDGGTIFLAGDARIVIQTTP